MWAGSRNAPQAACARLLAKTNAEPYSEPNTYRIGLRCSSCSVALYRDPEGVRASSKNPTASRIVMALRTRFAVKPRSSWSASSRRSMGNEPPPAPVQTRTERGRQQASERRLDSGRRLAPARDGLGCRAEGGTAPALVTDEMDAKLQGTSARNYSV